MNHTESHLVLLLCGTMFVCTVCRLPEEEQHPAIILFVDEVLIAIAVYLTLIYYLLNLLAFDVFLCLRSGH